MTDCLTAIEALAIHADQIARYGGAPGIRDPGQLEAALFRPQTGYYADLIEEAAALWESMAQNHLFIDGNKRAGFAVTWTFLTINGLHMTAAAAETHGFIIGLHDAGHFQFDRLAIWLRANTAPAAIPGEGQT